MAIGGIMAKRGTPKYKTVKEKELEREKELKEFCKKHKREVPRLIVQEVMEKKNFSHSDLSIALGIKNPSNVQRIKTSQGLSFETIVKIAVAMGVKVKDLIDE